MKKSIPVMVLIGIVLIAVLSGCASSTPALSTSTPVPTETPMYNGLIIASMDFTFQISEVALEETVKVINEPGYSSHMEGLILSPSGAIPKNATGDAIMILDLKLETGDKQKFLGFEPKIIEDNEEKSAIEVITEDTGNRFLWIYDVSGSSRSFVLKLPNGTIDLQPIIRLKSATP